MKKIIEHLTAREEKAVKEATEKIYKELNEKFREQVKAVSKEQDWEQSAVTSAYGLFPEINVDEFVNKLEGKGKDIEAFEEVVKETILEEKKESIPEALRHFITEDGEVDEETVSEIKVALADRATVKEFETFKTTAFAKNLKEGYDITIDNFKTLKERINDNMLGKIMNGELKEDKFIGAAFEAKTKVEEEKVVEETPEEKIARLKKESEVKGRVLTPEEEAEISEHNKTEKFRAEVAFLVDQKRKTLTAQGTKDIPKEELEAKLEEYEKQIVEKLKNQND